MRPLKADTVQHASGGAVTLTKQEASKASINYKGTSTNLIRASLNMSSVTDNGTGDYTYTITNAFSNTDYICVSGGGVSSIPARQGPGIDSDDVTTTSWDAECGSNTTAKDDWDIVNWSVLGDLA